MRAIAGALVGIVATAAAAQVTPPLPAEPILFADAAEVQALVGKAKASIRPGQPSVVQTLLRLASYRAVLEYRVAATPANTHVDDNELVYVLQGSGAVVIGGTLVGGKAAGRNIIGTGIDGGSARHLSAGDIFIVPRNTPHWFNRIDGTMIMISMHLPQPTPEKQAR